MVETIGFGKLHVERCGNTDVIRQHGVPNFSCISHESYALDYEEAFLSWC